MQDTFTLHCNRNDINGASNDKNHSSTVIIFIVFNAIIADIYTR